MTATTNQLRFYSFPNCFSIGWEWSSLETFYTELKAELHSDSFECHPLSSELILFSLGNLLLGLYCCLLWFFLTASGMYLQIFLMSSSDWDIFLLSSKQESASWDEYLQGGPPFLLAVLITSSSSKSPGGNLKPFPFCPGKLLDLHFFFFSLKFKKNLSKLMSPGTGENPFLSESLLLRVLGTVLRLWFHPHGVSWKQFQMCKLTLLLLWFVSISGASLVARMVKNLPAMQ